MATKKSPAKAVKTTAKKPTTKKTTVKPEVKTKEQTKPVAKTAVKPVAKKTVKPAAKKDVVKPTVVKEVKPGKAMTPGNIKVAVKKPEPKKVEAKPVIASTPAVVAQPTQTIGKVSLSSITKSVPAPTHVAKPGAGKISFADLMSKMTSNMSSAVVSGQAR